MIAGYYGDESSGECLTCPPGCSMCDNQSCFACLNGWRSKGSTCVTKRSSCDLRELKYQNSNFL